ncbi:MAG TPA: Ca2+-dependent phosphoinositide-specific phospholipase C [Elusimicrobiota bacterium]|nr:Ca2+-dependent phosphoinositide-specific phospholipase C [Elusimicrobiota bacterium]
MRVFARAIAILICGLINGGAVGMPAAGTECDLKAKDAKTAGPDCAAAWLDTHLRINEIQSVGTAESYKLRPSPFMLTLINMGSKADAQQLDFGEPPIQSQLSLGARSLTFDIAYDPEGGAYEHPAGALMAGQFLEDSYIATMSKPGFKVIHILDIDFNSSCLTLAACLQSVANWSRKNAGHLPIIIMLRTNDDRTPMPGATTPVKFNSGAFDALDNQIRSIFAPSELITPDMVQGKFPTLRDAVQASNWPTVGASRGKILFVLDDNAGKVALYRGSRRSLEGRAMFVATDEKSPAAAFITVENPLTAAAAITKDVRAGFMVHTYSDADTKEARKGNTRRRDASLSSGAQIISTDFMRADPRIGFYEVRMPGGKIAQCDVLLPAKRCSGQDAALEDTGLAFPEPPAAKALPRH